MQNSRGFRALKVWLGLRQVGRAGYERMVRDDGALAQALYRAADAHAELQACSRSLSIATFRFIPENLSGSEEVVESYLDGLNRELLNQLQVRGTAYLSNAVIEERFFLRVCVVNFRTTLDDIEALPEIVVGLGRELDLHMRPRNLKGF